MREIANIAFCCIAVSCLLPAVGGAKESSSSRFTLTGDGQQKAASLPDLGAFETVGEPGEEP